jgi:hypothetical protein
VSGVELGRNLLRSSFDTAFQSQGALGGNKDTETRFRKAFLVRVLRQIHHSRGEATAYAGNRFDQTVDFLLA